MSLFVNLPQDEAFRLVMDYFTQKNLKISASNSPSHILAEFGPWISTSLGEAKGEVEANIIKRKGGSYVNLSFSFLRAYLTGMLVAAIFAVIFYGCIWLIASIRMPEIEPMAIGEYLSFVSAVSILMTIVIFVVPMGVSAYNVSLTRRRLMEEFRRSLSIRDILSIKRNKLPNLE